MRSNLSVLPVNAKIAVVGGGVSGLTFTYFLSKLRPDVNITLYEGNKRCGGWIHSDEIKDRYGNSIMVEKGPRTLRGVSDGSVIIVDTLRDLGKEDAVQYIDSKSDANRKFLVDKDNHLVQVPNSASSFFKFLSGSLGNGFLSGILGEPFRAPTVNKNGDETAHDFIKRRFGSAHMSNNVFSAIFHGVYAGDIKKLSAKRTVGKMMQMESEAGSLIKYLIKNAMSKYKTKKVGDNVKKVELSPVLKKYGEATNKTEGQLAQLSTKLKKYPMIGFKTGLELYPKTLYEKILQLPNVSILNEKVVSLKPLSGTAVAVATDSGSSDYKHVRLTINPNKMTSLVPSTELAEHLKKVHSNTVILVNFYLPQKDVIPSYHGFGYLVPQSNLNHEKLLGVIFDSVIETNFQPVFGVPKEPTQSADPPCTKLTAMLGGHYLNDQGTNNIPSNSVIINTVKNAFQKHLNITQKDLDNATWEVTIAKDCLPQYHVGYDQWVEETLTEFKDTYADAVSLGGMAFSTGPGVPNVIEDAFESAYSLAK